MNDALLTNQSYCLDIQIALKDYLLHNTTSDITPTLLWEAHKPVIRGTCISVASHLKKDRIHKQQQLESEYHQSFLQFQTSPTEAHKRTLDKIKLELDILLAETADKSIRRSNHTIYTKANKPDTFLALRLRRPDRVRAPIRLRLSKDNVTSNPIKVLSEFRRRLSKLYEAGTAFPTRQAEKLFHNLPIPTLSTDSRESMESAITVEEVLAAIKTLKPHKRPGPDGLPSLYYKKFAAELAPLLTNAFNALLKQHSFGRDTLTALISMIPKPNTDNTIWSNFRPISLLNVDIKILAKILALRLNPIIGSLIHKDQVGFIPKRQASDNIRRVILLQHLARSRKIPMHLLSLDIRKAFDTVSWSYLLYILQRWGFGPHFLDWINALYNHPQAYVQYSGFRSNPFPISRGTRQGCPLSPLLFALAIEPLAALIRTNPDVRGLEIASTMHKLCLFADDALLFITSPHTTLPNLMCILDKFSLVSGLEVNQTKSKALNVSLPQTDFELLRQNYSFNWSTTSIPYLGIKLTSDPLNLFHSNYLPMLTQLSSLLNSWQPLCVSWLGRVAAVKMSLLPKLLYLYRVLPIAIPPYYHRTIQNRVFKYIWGPTKPRVARSVLLRHKLNGGLGIPSFLHYYHAARLAQATLYHSRNETPIWVSLEAIDLHPITVTNLLWLPPAARGAITNPITQCTLKHWDRLRTPYKLVSSHSPLLSFLGHPQFNPALSEPTLFQAWAQAGLTRISDLLSGNSIKPFPVIQAQAHLSPKECFRYLQIAHFVKTNLKSSTELDTQTEFEDICDSDPHAPGIISRLYTHLTTSTTNLPTYARQWSKDLNIELEADDWSTIWTNTKNSSQNVVASEANYKVLMRWYLVPSRIAKYLPEYPPTCFRGCKDEGTHTHIWWTCPLVQRFWATAFQMASTLHQVTLEPNPTIALLNLIPQDYTKAQRCLLLHLFTAAKQTIAKAWKTPALNTIEMQNRVTQAMIHSKIEAIILDKVPQHFRVWQPWIENFLPPDIDMSLLEP